jgi:hypothetical protein
MKTNKKLLAQLLKHAEHVGTNSANWDKYQHYLAEINCTLTFLGAAGVLSMVDSADVFMTFSDSHDRQLDKLKQ